MKAVVLNANVKSIDEDIKVVDDHPIPAILPGTALVKVVKAAINPVDNLLALGIMTQAYGWVQPFPYVGGEDFSGVVHSIASDVTHVRVGDEVFASNWGQGRHDDMISNPIVGGAFSEFVLIPAHKLSLKPPGITHAQAASIGIAGTTAHECLFLHGKVTAGTKVLILGASSSVGQFACQMAKNVGAYVAGTCSARTFSFVKQNLDVDHLINYNERDWAHDDSVKGYDVVFDTVGEKDGLSRARSNGTVKSDGRFISIADFSIGLDPSAYPPLSFGAAICFLQNTQTQDEIARWIEEGKIKVFFDSYFDLTTDGARGIYGKIASGKSLGKNILNVSI